MYFYALTSCLFSSLSHVDLPSLFLSLSLCHIVCSYSTHAIRLDRLATQIFRAYHAFATWLSF